MGRDPQASAPANDRPALGIGTVGRQPRSWGTDQGALRRGPEPRPSLAAEGRHQLSVYDRWPRGEPADTARRLGIEHLERVSPDDPSSVMFLLGGMGCMVPDDANVVTDWIENVLSDPDYADTSAKFACR